MKRVPASAWQHESVHRQFSRAFGLVILGTFLLLSATGAIAAWLYVRGDLFASDGTTRTVESARERDGGVDVAPDSSGYGWVDRDARVARIPVERAMQLLAEPQPQETQ